MNLTIALHKLGYPENLKGSQSKYVYKSDGGTWICTMWNDRTDYDAGIAHVNNNHAREFRPGNLVKVVHIERKRLESGFSKIVAEVPSPDLWTIACLIEPTPGFRRHRAFLLRGVVDAKVHARS